jgi:hypothetical protein
LPCAKTIPEREKINKVDRISRLFFNISKPINFLLII